MHAIDRTRRHLNRFGVIAVAVILALPGVCFSADVRDTEARHEVEDADAPHEVEDADQRREVQ